jgi:hypothetical protein
MRRGDLNIEPSMPAPSPLFDALIRREQAFADAADPFAATINARLDALGNPPPAPKLTPRETEKARLIALVLSAEETDTARALAAEELFALGRLVELDHQMTILREINERASAPIGVREFLQAG